MSALHGICQPSFGGGSAPTRSAGEILILTNSEKGKSFLLSKSNSRTYEWVCSPAAKCYKISVHSRDRGIGLPPGSSCYVSPVLTILRLRSERSCGAAD